MDEVMCRQVCHLPACQSDKSGIFDRLVRVVYAYRLALLRTLVVLGSIGANLKYEQRVKRHTRKEILFKLQRVGIPRCCC